MVSRRRRGRNQGAGRVITMKVLGTWKALYFAVEHAQRTPKGRGKLRRERGCSLKQQPSIYATRSRQHAARVPGFESADKVWCCSGDIGDGSSAQFVQHLGILTSVVRRLSTRF